MISVIFHQTIVHRDDDKEVAMAFRYGTEVPALPPIGAKISTRDRKEEVCGTVQEIEYDVRIKRYAIFLEEWTIIGARWKFDQEVDVLQRNGWVFDAEHSSVDSPTAK